MTHLVGRLVTVVALVLPTVAHAQTAARANDREIAERADRYMQAQTDAGFFSGAVLIAVGGKPLFAKAYGFADADRKVPNTIDTRYRIASITKTFTAALILQLHQEKRLNLQDSICEFMESCAPHWQSVTVRHLLTHTSGIPSYTNAPDFFSRAVSPEGADEIDDDLRERALEFAPGEQYRYSNSNYVLLGLIAERTGGMPYAQLLRKRLLDPLEMRDSGYAVEREPPRSAVGYRPDGLGVEKAPPMHVEWLYAAGGMYSTVGDLLKWDRALYTNEILSDALREAMWTADKGDYGYGWQVLAPSPRTFGRALLLHAGGVNGFATDLLRYPHERVSIILLANLETAPMEKLSRDVSAIVFGEAYEMPVVRHAVSVNPAIFDAYVGEYEITPTMSLRVFTEEGRLLVQATGQPRDVAIPASETYYFSRMTDAQLTFVKNAAGRVDHLVIHQGGEDIRAGRK